MERIPKMSVKFSKQIKRVVVNTKNAPKAIGPYNQAILIDRTLYISGQLGLDPDTMEIVEGGVEEETIQALKNLHMILRRAHSDFSDVIKTTILLKDMRDFKLVNDIYSQCFVENLPARMAFEVDFYFIFIRRKLDTNAMKLLINHPGNCRFKVF